MDENLKKTVEEYRRRLTPKNIAIGIVVSAIIIGANWFYYQLYPKVAYFYDSRGCSECSKRMKSPKWYVMNYSNPVRRIDIASMSDKDSKFIKDTALDSIVSDSLYVKSNRNRYRDKWVRYPGDMNNERKMAAFIDYHRSHLASAKKYALYKMA